MSLPSKSDVLVVGFGPVGAAVASLLGGHGVRTLVIDRSPELLTHPRAIALDNEALRILQLAGLSEDSFATIAIPYVCMHSPYCGEFARINTRGTIDGHPKLVTFFQPELERALREKVATHPSVHTALGVELTGLEERGEAVIARLRLADGSEAEVEATYVVGADGASSAVRRLCGLDFRGRTYAEDWLIVDARNVPRPIDHVEFLCHPSRPTPHMVAPGGRERWEFMLRPGESSEELATDESIRRLLSRWGRPEDMVIERKAVYRFHARVAHAFRRNRVFLAGDAAHITPPFVGQGLVAGLRDAANLSWKLAWVLRHRASPSILDSYDTERRPHARAMIALARAMGRLVMPRNAAVALLTHGPMRLSRLVPPLRSYIEDLGMKPKNRFKRGLFVRGRTRSCLVRGGVLPQGWLRGADGSVRLSDDVFGPSLTLIGFGLDAGSQLDAATRAAFAAAGGRAVQILHRGQRLHRAAHGDSWEDLHEALIPGAAPFGWAAIVRPDRTVLHDGPVTEAGRLVREALDLIGAPRADEVATAFLSCRIPGGAPMSRLLTPQPARHPDPTVKARALAYLMFERPDLELTERFLTDFGLRTVARTKGALFLRGTAPTPFCYVVLQGDEPRFVGFGLRVGSRGELEKLAALPGASAIEPVSWPGGGERVCLTDPSGFTVHAVSGAAEAEALPHRAPMPLNSADAHPRINDTQRPPVAPPEVIRLGHVVLEVADFQATAGWYAQHFGFIPSDVQVLPDGSPAVAFLRLDLGDRPADHHTLALAQGVVPTYSHSAFEVVDADAVGMGQRVLRERGWRHAWGIGRHILGSQIFDYWHDPHGDKHEHYTDGDLCTADVATGVYPTSRDAMAQWGQPMPRAFTQPRLTPGMLVRVLSNLRRSPDLSVGKLLTLARLFG